MGKKKKKNNIQLTEEDLRKIEESRIREQKRKSGFFDGRYCQKPMQNNKYSRKIKHKNKDYEE